MNTERSLDSFTNEEYIPENTLHTGEEDSLLSGLGIPYSCDLITVLRDPNTGNLAYVVGTAHVSPQAAQDVTAVISAVQPNIIAVEAAAESAKHTRENTSIRGGPFHLDEVRMKAARKILQEGPPKPPTSVWQVLRKVYVQWEPMWQVAITLPTATYAALLGVPYGSDMLTALQVADELGTKVAPIDRSARITFQRATSQWRAAVKGKAEAEKTAPGKFTPERMEGMLVKRAEAAGCEDPRGTVEALFRVLRTAREEKSISTDDLLRVRHCGRRLVEKIRRSPEDLQAADLPGRFPALHELPALHHERDLILAQNLRRCTEKGTTVAVVGSAHLAGIRQRWDTALSPSSIMEAQHYLKMLPPSSANPMPERFQKSPPGTPPEQSPTGTGGGLLIGLGALGATSLLAYRRPRLVAKTAVFIGVVGVAGQVGFAAMVAKYGRMVGKLQETSERLAMDGEQESF